jgi:DNA-directed RNA polymerase specialized sigma24 family protein
LARVFDISPEEVRTLEALERMGSVREASEHLGIPQKTIEARLFRLRLRYDKALTFIDRYQAWRSRLRGRYL